MHKQANSPGTGLPMILSKLFRPEGRMWRVKRNEDKKAGKKRRKRSKRKFGTVLGKKKQLAHEHAPK